MDTTNYSNASSIAMYHATRFPMDPCQSCKNPVSPQDICVFEPCGHGPLHHSCVVQIEQSNLSRVGLKYIMHCPQCNSAVDQILYDYMDGIPRGSRSPFSRPRRTQPYEAIPNFTGIPPSISSLNTSRPNQRTTFIPQHGSLTNQVEPSAPLLEISQNTSLKQVKIQDTPRQHPIGAREIGLYPTPSEGASNYGDTHRGSFQPSLPHSFPSGIKVCDQYREENEFDMNTRSMPNLTRKKLTKPPPSANIVRNEMNHRYENGLYQHFSPVPTNMQSNSPSGRSIASSWNETGNFSPLAANNFRSPPRRDETPISNTGTSMISEKGRSPAHNEPVYLDGSARKRVSQRRSDEPKRRGRDPREEVQTAYTITCLQIKATVVPRNEKIKPIEKRPNIPSEGKPGRFNGRRDTKSSASSSKKSTSSVRDFLRSVLKEL